MMLRYPWLLVLVMLVPALVYLRYARKRRPALRFSDGNALAGLPRGWSIRMQPLLPVLYAMGLVLLIIALTRPQAGLGESRVRTDGVDILLLVDVSPSMAAEDFSTASKTMNRLAAAKLVIAKFVEKRSADRIGMVAFAALPFPISPLTLDHGWLIEQMKRLEHGELGDGTGIGTALASAINRLRDSKARSKIIILLTDGMSNVGELTPENAALAAKALGIKIYTVAAGAWMASSKFPCAARSEAYTMCANVRRLMNLRCAAFPTSPADCSSALATCKDWNRSTLRSTNWRRRKSK
jgi:Ca-activated chloride channel family protein